MSIINDIKYGYLKSTNAVKKIIMVNVLTFIAMMLPFVFFFLLQINTAIYNEFINWFKLPASLSKLMWQPWSLVTYMFLHDGIFHILFNMLWLYWIGNVLQEYLGNTKVYECYFGGGLAGALMLIVAYHIFPVFSASITTAYAVGASAGVLAIIVGTATLLPDYTIRLFLFGDVRLKYIALITVLLDILLIPQQNPGGHIAHLGGAAFGLFYIKYIYKHGQLIPQSVYDLFERKSNIKVHYKNTAGAGNVSKMELKPTQYEVDRILDKISKSGYDSLSKKEKEVLFNASK
jgi:membrane associated rhomboid family serine protease